MLWEKEEPLPNTKGFNMAAYNLMSIGVNPNDSNGSLEKTYTPGKIFYEFSKKIMKEAGATILGGCCETRSRSY